MPSKKKKYNARFPAGRIKKIMQSDEEIGKVAQAVPVIISRTLELFVESLLNKTLKITSSRNAKTLSTSHMKQCIMGEQRFDFLRELVKNIPDISVAEETASYIDDEMQSSPEPQNYPDSDTPYDLSMPSTSTRSVANGTYQRPQFPTRSNQNGTKLPTSSSASVQNEQMLPYVTERSTFLKTTAALALGDIPTGGSDGHNQMCDKELTTSITREEALLRPGVTAMSSVITSTQKHQELGTVAYGINERELGNFFVASMSEATSSAFKKCELLKHENSKKHVCQQKAITLNVTSSNSSVIKHTNASQDSYTPQKLSRTDSGPPIEVINWDPTDMPHPHSESVTSRSDAQSNEPNSNTAHPLIPAPIVSIDFCKKPVVKIDYSNLSIPPTKQSASIIEPLHTPPSVKGSASKKISAHVNQEPVINIDLSNIVTSSGREINNERALSKISIGNIAPMPSFLNPSLAAQLNLSNNAINFSRTNSNSVPSSTSDQPSIVLSGAVASPLTAAVKNNNSFFELDEDYDNI